MTDQNSNRQSRLVFDSVDDAHAWIDAWVLRHQPVGTAADLAEFERQHLAEFHAEFGRLAAYFHVSFDVLVALVDEVNYVDKAAWPPHRALQFMLLSHNMKAFVSAFDRLSKGYYEDSIAIARGPYETIARLMFMSCHKEAPYGALFDKTPPGTPSFNLTGFLRDELRLDWTSIYSTMSVFAHSNIPAVLRSLDRNSKRVGTPERFGLTFEDDEVTLGVAAILLPFLLLAYTRFVVERLIGDAKLRDPLLLQSANESIAWLEVVVEGDGDKPLWTGVRADLDYLFVLLELADEDGDWKRCRNKRAEVKARRVNFDAFADDASTETG